MHRLSAFFGILLLLALPACAQFGEPPPVACDTMIDPALRAADLDMLPESEIVAWIETHYGERRLVSEREFRESDFLKIPLGPNSTAMHENPNREAEQEEMLINGIVVGTSSSGATYSWLWNGQTYTAHYFNAENSLMRIEVAFNPQPAFADLDRCFGKPAFYELSFYEHNYEWLILYLVSKPTYSSTFSLYYPDAGLYFFDTREGDGHDKPDLTMQTRVETGNIIRQQPVLEMMQDITPDFVGGILAPSMEDVAPFPETWEEMEYLFAP